MGSTKGSVHPGPGPAALKETLAHALELSRGIREHWVAHCKCPLPSLVATIGDAPTFLPAGAAERMKNLGEVTRLVTFVVEHHSAATAPNELHSQTIGTRAFRFEYTLKD